MYIQEVASEEAYGLVYNGINLTNPFKLVKNHRIYTFQNINRAYKTLGFKFDVRVVANVISNLNKNSLFKNYKIQIFKNTQKFTTKG